MSTQQGLLMTEKPKKGDITFLFDTGFFSKKNIQRDKSVLYKAKAEGVEDREFDRVIEGYANVKVVDRIGDIIRPEAFKYRLDEYMINPQLRFNHEEGSSIGMVTEVEIREDGLWVQAAIGDWDLANEKWKQIEFGSLRALSIMGRTIDFEEKEIEMPNGETQMVWDITKFQLIENSIVEIPMNQLSLFEKKGMSQKDALLKVLARVSEKLEKNYLERKSSEGVSKNLELRLQKMTKNLDNESESEDEDYIEAEVTETLKADEEEEMQEEPSEEEEESTSVEENIKTILQILENEIPAIREKQNEMDERISALEESAEESPEPKNYKRTQKIKISKGSIEAVISKKVEKLVGVEIEKAFKGIDIEGKVEKTIDRAIALSDKIVYKTSGNYNLGESEVEEGLKDWVKSNRKAAIERGVL